MEQYSIEKTEIQRIWGKNGEKLTKLSVNMVHGEGLEPTRLAAKEPKSFVSAISPAVHHTVI